MINTPVLRVGRAWGSQGCRLFVHHILKVSCQTTPRQHQTKWLNRTAQDPRHQSTVASGLSWDRVKTQSKWTVLPPYGMGFAGYHEWRLRQARQTFYVSIYVNPIHIFGQPRASRTCWYFWMAELTTTRKNRNNDIQFLKKSKSTIGIRSRDSVAVRVQVWASRMRISRQMGPFRSRYPIYTQNRPVTPNVS